MHTTVLEVGVRACFEAALAFLMRFHVARGLSGNPCIYQGTRASSTPCAFPTKQALVLQHERWQPCVLSGMKGPVNENTVYDADRPFSCLAHIASTGCVSPS